MPQSPPNRLAHLRKEAGLTQQQLAAAVDTHWITISKLERGKSKLTLDWMMKLAPIIQATPADMVADDSELEVEVKAEGEASPEVAKAQRLRLARREAGYATATAAARAMGWTLGTYLSHENGTRGIKQREVVQYAAAFGIDPGWLEFGKMPIVAPSAKTTPAAPSSALDRFRNDHTAAERRLEALHAAVREAEKEVEALALAIRHLSAE